MAPRAAAGCMCAQTHLTKTQLPWPRVWDTPVGIEYARANALTAFAAIAVLPHFQLQ